MYSISTILVPYDFSETAHHALKYAVEFVGRSNIGIILAFISEDEKALAKAEDSFQKVKDEYARDLEIPLKWILGKGNLTKAIVGFQKEHKIDLVIMGTSGAYEGHDVSHTSELLQEADFPIIVVPKEVDECLVKNISLVLGQNEIDDHRTLATLLEVARKFNAQVHVLTVENKPGLYGYSEADEENENNLMYYLESFYAEHTFIENTDIVSGIFDFVEKNEIDMIAILSRKHTKNVAPSKGLLTKELALRSKVPILSID